MRLENAYLCVCGLIGVNAMQCQCGQREALLSLSSVLNRKIVSHETQAILGTLADVLGEKVFA